MLNFKSYGRGEPIIILHGLFGMLDNWKRFADAFSDHHSVFLVDLRNHGRSPHLEEMNYEVMAEDVWSFMQENHIYEATVLGHSMGGKVAMQLAMHEPDYIQKLIVVDIAPKAYRPHHQTVIDALQAIPIDLIGTRHEVNDILLEYLDDEGTRLFLQKNLMRKKEGGYRWKMNLPVIIKNYDRILEAVEFDGHYDNPTLFIRGGQSKYISDEDMLWIKEILPHAQIETIEHAGHWVHVDAFEELKSIVKSFL